jgi:hypothetical protein
MMKVFKGKDERKRESEEKIIADAGVTGDADAWYLFKFFDTNTRRWSPVYCAFSLSAAHDEMEELRKKLPKRAFLMKGIGSIAGSQLDAAVHYKVYIGDEYEDIG